MRCVSCGTDLIPGKQFCHACGTRVLRTCASCGETIEAGYSWPRHVISLAVVGGAIGGGERGA